MSPRLRLLLASCAVGLLGLIVSAVFDWRAGMMTILVAASGLLLGLFAARSGARAHDDSRDAPPSPRGELRPERARPAAPAGALLEATMNGMREGVLVIDASLRVVSANNAARSVFGRDAGAPALQPLSSLTRSPDIHAAYRAALERGEDNQVKVELLGTERRVFELRVAPLRLGGERGAIGVFFDITELERLERVRQEFLSNVSHELRTPLTAIIAFVETLENGALDEPETARHFLSVIHRNAERMHTLIEDIMELSAIESGRTQVDARRLRLSPLVQETLSALAAKAEACGVTLVNDVSADATAFADPRRLEQMLLNLVDNAIKFSRRGGAVTVGHSRGERDLITVTDTGEGIPAEHLARIFERFYRVDRARAREMGGTGLGLAIVKHLARAHGGEVGVRSAPGAGSTFTIELPLEPSDATDAA